MKLTSSTVTLMCHLRTPRSFAGIVDRRRREGSEKNIAAASLSLLTQELKVAGRRTSEELVQESRFNTFLFKDKVVLLYFHELQKVASPSSCRTRNGVSL